MAAVELDRQGIERRDFPIGRRGYDPAAVDAHLRAVAVEVEELQRMALGAGHDLSLASAAGNQVQSVIEAAEAAAAEIERQTVEGARQAREAADRDAERAREDAVETARAHVTGVAQVASSLLERVGAMDAEVRALLDSLRAGAGRLAADLAAVEANMGELYDAAAGQAYGPAGQAYGPTGQAYPAPEPAQPQFEAELAGAMQAPAPPPPPPAPAPAPPVAQAPAAGEPAPQGAPEDVDGARLIALNMALNGESRADTERYLAENFQLPDRGALVDEVYAAIEA
jgi:DivIVA domain-containing protein